MQKFWPLLVLIAVGILGLMLLNWESTPEPPPTELKIEDLKVGEGPEAKTGDEVEVHYTGWLFSNGEKFDSSLDRGEPFSFPLGQGRVIQGWDKGVVGMKAGGKRRLIIPANLAYGPGGSGKIPPNSALKFEVELLRIVK